jgi:Raf kinase inhibitor-like YbhB/YbcL family protein
VSKNAYLDTIWTLIKNVISFLSVFSLRSRRMRRLIIIIVVVMIVGLAALALYLAPMITYSEKTTAVSFKLGSETFSDGGVIPAKYTCDGLDVSPPLHWSDYPLTTESFVLIVEDIDAPGGIFTHWLLYNLPANINRLEEVVEKVDELPSGALQGVNDFGRVGYGGPCPPPGKPHRYVFKMYALDEVLDLKPRMSRQELLNSIKGHVIAEAHLTGIYSR